MNVMKIIVFGLREISFCNENKIKFSMKLFLIEVREWMSGRRVDDNESEWEIERVRERIRA